MNVPVIHEHTFGEYMRILRELGVKPKSYNLVSPREHARLAQR